MIPHTHTPSPKLPRNQEKHHDPALKDAENIASDLFRIGA